MDNKTKTTRVVAVRVSEEEYSLLEAMAKAFQMSKGKLVHEMLKVGFDLAKKPVGVAKENGNI